MSEGELVVLVAPEGALSLTLADFEEADAARAVTRAWKLRSPGFQLYPADRIVAA